MAYTESVPTRPGAIDGVLVDGTADGAWTEDEEQGAYTYIGYDKEMKPFRRFTHTDEAVPSNALYVSTIADGGHLADGSVYAGSSVQGRTLEGKPA
jgi:hypothetical protein